MRNAVALPFVLVALASLVVAGCGAGGQTAATTAAPTPFPTPTIACTSPPGYTIQQVFPQNGVTGVANLQGVVFDIGPNPQPGGVPSPLPTNWYFYVKSAFGTSAFVSVPFLATPVPQPGASAGATPTPLPTPSDAPSSPTFTNYLQETASIGNFATSTGFSVFLANTSCYPGLPESTFTTAPTDTPTTVASPTASPT
jgi:hypothetical protein